MTLRAKTLVIIGVTTFSLVLILYVTSQTILLGSFGRLEKQLAGQDIERAMGALSNEIAVLDLVAHNWAARDDTYTFVQSPSDEYIRSNLVDEAFVGERINLILFINDDDQVVFGRAYDMHHERQMSAPESLRAHLTRNAPLLQHDDVKSTVAGIVLLPEGPLLVASRPILTSAQAGPIRGTLIVGRYLDAVEIERLAEATHLSLALRRYDDAQMPRDFEVARSFFIDSGSKGTSIFVQALGIESIAGYGVLENIYGDPCLILRAGTPREIYNQGRISALYFISALVAVSLIFGLMTLLLLEIVILSRLTRLDADVSRIGMSGDPSTRVSVTGKDELSSLAGTINEMLTALEQSQSELRESAQRFHDVACTTGDWIWEMDAEGRYTYVSPVVEQVLGYTSAEVVGRHYGDFFHPDERERLVAQIQEALRERRAIVRLPSPSIHKGGDRVILETSGLPLTDAEGNLLGYRGAHRDVTAERRLRERLDTVYTLGRELVLSANEQQVTEVVMDAARLMSRCQLCDLWLVNEEEETLVRRAVKATEQVRAGDVAALPLGSERGVVVAVARTGEPIYLPDVREDPRYIDAGVRGHSEFCVPLKVGTRVIGVLNAESTELDAFDLEEQQLFLTLADQASLAIENARLYEQMRLGRDRLQALSRRLVEVQEAERRHLARELHDEIGQLLTGLKLNLEMSKRLPADAVKTSLDQAQELVNGLVTEVRDLSLDLRPTMLDDLGLLPALLWHFERYTLRTNVRVHLKHTGLERRRFAPEVETAAYRVAQEALTNVARYAGVSEVTVRLWADQDTLGVQIEDQGTGFDPKIALNAGATGGLSGMHERVALLGGQLAIELASEGGTCLTAEFPLAASPGASILQDEQDLQDKAIE